jgi:hypothetical protein
VQPLAHAVAIGEARQRIVLGQPRSIFLALTRRSDIRAVAALANEIAVRGELRAARD